MVSVVWAHCPTWITAPGVGRLTLYTVVSAKPPVLLFFVSILSVFSLCVGLSSFVRSCTVDRHGGQSARAAYYRYYSGLLPDVAMATAGPATKTRWTDPAVNGRSQRTLIQNGVPPPLQQWLPTSLLPRSFVFSLVRSSLFLTLSFVRSFVSISHFEFRLFVRLYFSR